MIMFLSIVINNLSAYFSQTQTLTLSEKLVYSG